MAGQAAQSHSANRKDLPGYLKRALKKQKGKVIQNTLQFLKGLPANDGRAGQARAAPENRQRPRPADRV